MSSVQASPTRVSSQFPDPESDAEESVIQNTTNKP